MDYLLFRFKCYLQLLCGYAITFDIVIRSPYFVRSSHSFFMKFTLLRYIKFVMFKCWIHYKCCIKMCQSKYYNPLLLYISNERVFIDVLIAIKSIYFKLFASFGKHLKKTIFKRLLPIIKTQNIIPSIRFGFHSYHYNIYTY